MLNSLELASCLFAAASVFTAGWLFLSIVLIPRRDLNNTTQQNRQRILKLRQGSVIYRLWEPILPQLADVSFIRTLTRISILKNYLGSGASDLPFTTAELAGWVVIRGLALASCVTVIFFLFGNFWLGLMIAGGIVIFYPFWFSRLGQKRMADRLHRITKRLAHATDLLAMQLNAGASFRNAFSLITHELNGHPLGQEFDRVIRDTEQGMSFRDSLDQLQNRIPTDEIRAFVGAIQSSQRRGTPLAKTLNNLAEQMRRYRSERAERAAGEAQANITFPGLVMMGACLLVLLAPFVLQLIEENPFDF